MSTITRQRMISEKEIEALQDHIEALFEDLKDCKNNAETVKACISLIDDFGIDAEKINDPDLYEKVHAEMQRQESDGYWTGVAMSVMYGK